MMYLFLVMASTDYLIVFSDVSKAPKGTVSQMMKDPLSLIEDKTLANEVQQVTINNKSKLWLNLQCTSISLFICGFMVSIVWYKSEDCNKVKQKRKASVEWPQLVMNACKCFFLLQNAFFFSFPLNILTPLSYVKLLHCMIDGRNLHCSGPFPSCFLISLCPLSVKPFIWKWVFIHLQIKLIFIYLFLHLTLLRRIM